MSPACLSIVNSALAPTALVAQHERLRANQREALRQAEHLFQSLLQRAFAKNM